MGKYSTQSRILLLCLVMALGYLMPVEAYTVTFTNYTDKVVQFYFQSGTPIPGVPDGKGSDEVYVKASTVDASGKIVPGVETRSLNTTYINGLLRAKYDGAGLCHAMGYPFFNKDDNTCDKYVPKLYTNILYHGDYGNGSVDKIFYDVTYDIYPSDYEQSMKLLQEQELLLQQIAEYKNKYAELTSHVEDEVDDKIKNGLAPVNINTIVAKNINDTLTQERIADGLKISHEREIKTLGDSLQTDEFLIDQIIVENIDKQPVIEIIPSPIKNTINCKNLTDTSAFINMSEPGAKEKFVAAMTAYAAGNKVKMTFGYGPLGDNYSCNLSKITVMHQQEQF